MLNAILMDTQYSYLWSSSNSNNPIKKIILKMKRIRIYKRIFKNKPGYLFFRYPIVSTLCVIYGLCIETGLFFTLLAWIEIIIYEIVKYFNDFCSHLSIYISTTIPILNQLYGAIAFRAIKSLFKNFNINCYHLFFNKQYRLSSAIIATFSIELINRFFFRVIIYNIVKNKQFFIGYRYFGFLFMIRRGVTVALFIECLKLGS